MTYCVALNLEEGLVLCADTRTNASLDNIATFSKLHVIERPGERVIALMTAGNLAITQAAVTRLTESIPDINGNGGNGDMEATRATLWTVPSMIEAARLVGRTVRDLFDEDASNLMRHQVMFDATFLVAGQVGAGKQRLFMVYSAGNYVESSPDTPFFQLGEHKYGKPILDRVAKYDTSIEDAVKLVLISMDSTLRSNLTVGLPIDLLTYRRGSLHVGLQRRIGEDDAYFRTVRERWSEALRTGYRSLPAPQW